MTTDTMNKKRVLHLIDCIGIYGAEIMLLNLMEQQQKGDIIPILGSFRNKRETERPIESIAKKIGIPVEIFETTKGINLIYGIKIIKWAKENNISVIHTHGFKPNLLISFFPKKWRKIPILRTLHGWTSTTKWSKIGLYQLLDFFSLKFTDAIIVVSSAMAEKPPLLNSSLKIQVIPNGIKEPEIKSLKTNIDNTDEIFNFCNDSHKLLSIGRLSEEKGFDNLINSLVQLVKEGIDVKLCIIGEGPQRGDLESIIKKNNLQDKVLLAGYRENACKYMPLFDTYVLSSYTEGLPITILEAMHLGLPIIATKVGGVPKALNFGEAGLLLDDNNPESLSTNIKAFIEDIKKRKEMVVKAKNLAKSVYSSENMGQKYNEAYLQIKNL